MCDRGSTPLALDRHIRAAGLEGKRAAAPLSRARSVEVIRNLAPICLVAGFMMFSACTTAPDADTDADIDFDWRSDWTVQSGFSMAIDTEGYELPTSISFVPEPGEGPKDPLYFVTELRGKVKVVTNDRSVFTFAEGFFELGPIDAYGASPSLEVGLAGICLEPKRGYVFVTFVYEDRDRVLRNNIVRFQTKPIIFSVSPASQQSFTDVFSSDRSNPSHQIGPCQISDDLLYASVGDGEQPRQSQELGSLLGKIVRMTLDGSPVPDNPFYQDDDRKKAANYIWAYGFRNPFGLEIVDGRVFIADNGPQTDRFLEAREGENYLWDGSERSIGTNASVVLSPGQGVAQIEAYSQSSSSLPTRFEQSFFLVVTGSPVELAKDPPPHILNLAYDSELNRLRSVPKTFLRYRGRDTQVLTGVGLGPDGLYFVPLLPNREGVSAVFKIAFEPDRGHPFVLERELNPRILYLERGCRGCHSRDKQGDGNIGPNLNRDVLVSRLERRLNSQEYINAIGKIDLLDREPFASFKTARNEVMDAEGLGKIRLWVKNRILEPRFDNPNARMPNLGLSEAEAAAIADFLVMAEADDESGGVVKTVLRALPDPVRLRHLLMSLVAGVVIGVVGLTFSYLVFRKSRIRSIR